jgi:hypothetical protein
MTGYGVDGQGIAFRFPAKGKIYSLLYSVQTMSEAQSASYAMGMWAVSRGVKRPGCEAVYSPPSTAEVKINTSTAPFVFMAWWFIH